MIKLSPSLLSADFANLERDVKKIEEAGAPYVHIDVMDGHFVENITFGPAVVEAVGRVTDMVLDVHLMIENPEKYVNAFLQAGADIVTVHCECKPDFEYIRSQARKFGKKAAIAINPPTSLSELEPYEFNADMLLVMSVNPGFGAQAFIESTLDKVRALRERHPDIDIETDGGIKLGNVRRVIDAGANVIVAGSAIFGADDVQKAVREFTEKCRN